MYKRQHHLWSSLLLLVPELKVALVGEQKDVGGGRGNVLDVQPTKELGNWNTVVMESEKFTEEVLCRKLEAI